MSIEIEAKMRVESHEAVRVALSSAGGDRLGEVFEENLFFDTGDRALQTTDRGLRLRRMRDAGGDNERFVLTFKGPRLAGPLKRRVEHELAIDDRAAAMGLLEGLGYSITFAFEKKRESWTLGGCRIELDDVPPLGRFIEIEGPDESAVMAARLRLGLSNLPLIRESYVALLSAVQSPSPPS